MKTRYTIISSLLLLLTAVSAEAQIVIGGSVYGGGNAGDTGGSTTVTVRSGDIDEVFGGARMADVKGSAFVNIDGAHASNYIVINKVYGGNDIAGTIGTSSTLPVDENDQPILTKTAENNIDNTWNAFVRISTKTTTTGEEPNTTEEEAADAQKIYIGQLFGGGNGDYDYTSDGSPYKGKNKPELGKTYLEIVGGSIVYAYGGGNAATVTEKTVICVDNPSKVVNGIVDASNPNAGTGGELLTTDRFRDKMGINTGFSYPSSDAFQIGRLFGGNNKAEMAIRPIWNLKSGKIRNLYSGGNCGAMTNKEGLLLEIAADSEIKVDNVYGGCRMADVRPLKSGTIESGVYEESAVEDIDLNSLGYNFPKGLSARVLVRGGDINNVYGGNDITGKVYGGNAIGIHCSIRGDVFGGGNGSYPYTDKKDYENDDVYGDLYYDPTKVLKDAGITFSTAKLHSAEALNLFRPNAESVSIRLVGTETKHTIIGGSVYCGGNSATLRNDRNADAAAELKVGSYVYADKVFLGNNGENMVTYNAEEKDKNNNVTKKEGTLLTMRTVNTMNLTDKATFAKYMDGVSMRVRPRIVFDTKGDTGQDYIPYSTYFGSFYCGGNVGSMRFEGADTLDFSNKIVIFDKLVGGCNDAYVNAQDGINARYEGGVLEAPDDETGNKIIMNLSGLKIQPKRWVKDIKGDYVLDANGNRQLEWNIVKWDETQQKYVNDVAKSKTDPVPGKIGTIDGHDYNAGEEDLARRFTGGNIYGGCYNSGVVNGNVVINIDSVLVERDKLFDVVESDALGDEAVYYDKDYETPRYNITQYNTGVILGQQGMDVLGKALNVFGGGFGFESEIWGSTTINLNAGYVFQVFGGSEKGVIGKSLEEQGIDVTENNSELNTTKNYDYVFSANNYHYAYDPAYSCYINLKGKFPGVSKSNDKSNKMMAECEFMYGGGFFGPICGNTVINLGKGRIFNSFAGSCNADILGHTETYIGRMVKEDYSEKMGYLGKTKDTDNKTYLIDKEDYYEEGFPWVRDITYGGNDLGGKVLGSKDFTHRVNTATLPKVYGYDAKSTSHPEVLIAAAYTEYLQGRTDAIFGGCFGTYDYKDPIYGDYFNTDGSPKEGYSKPRMDNAFVNFRPTTSNAANMVNKIYGAGQGKSGDRDSDKMQDRSYVLIDAPQDWDVYKTMEVFGAGAWGGLGMNTIVDPDATTPPTKAQLDGVTAIVDLVKGHIGSAYGGSLNEGFTRRTLVNVPQGSTIKLGYLTNHTDSEGKPYTNTHYGNIFGGAFGEDNQVICDVYESNVEFHSSAASVAGAIYGGNNSFRRTLYAKVNIDVKVSNKDNGYMTTIYGAGLGENTWSQYTEVNLQSGASIWEVYGGGQNGKVTNKQTANWLTVNEYHDEHGLDIPSGYVDKGLNSALAKERHDGNKYNTNVLIHRGAVVNNYAYGGGKGTASINESGNVNGTTYIALLGGRVMKDLYAAGKAGNVLDLHGNTLPEGSRFIASANAYIAGGTVRNVYGGGYMGSVGKHGPVTYTDYEDLLAMDDTGDILGETHVTIGIRDDQSDADKLAAMKKVDAKAVLTDYGINNGVPAIQRNAYGGGEGETEKGGRGGAVWGTANLTLNNGYIGYVYLNGEYKEKLNDETWTEGSSDNWTPTDSIGRLRDCGNVFGGGYSDKSNVDFTNVTVWGGVIRNSLHGGAEVAAIGRGSTIEEGAKRTLKKPIYKAGGTRVTMYNGKVKHNVFGGGKGYNILGYGGANELYTDGYVFGSTKVFIHGGEIGTKEEVTIQPDGSGGYGNVFGGGDVGYVYSKGFFTDNSATNGKKSRNETTGSPNHWYYYDENNKLTEDCQVVISPYLQVKPGQTVNGKNGYEYVETDFLNSLPHKNADGTYTGTEWVKLYTGENAGKENAASLEDNVERGITIHNAVFAGGNVSSNNDKTYANATTVFGNTTATLYDVYHRDFITIGTEHIGGIYGGGNLSVVDGYRELNITNYGTDYYGLDQQISYEKYQQLTNRERAYFELEYVYNGTANVTIKGTTYKNGNHVKESIYNTFKDDPNYVATQWEKWGFCSIYAGRLLNTIQRADFCGVFGSRLVLQGAKDRVADVGDATEYTINRVGELSLNKQRSVVSGETNLKENHVDDEDYKDPQNAIHGNYFGIYSVVNYLGNLTSDVHFEDPRRYVVNGDTLKDTTKSYYKYKTSNLEGKNRRQCNNGISYNQVALASGVFLEMTTEHSTKTKKVYGDITGVVELDLINVKKDIVGGGYVYARNEHGKPQEGSHDNTLLSPYNQKDGNEALTKKIYSYSESATDIKSWQTSGNFIHKRKRIVDDCYPNNGEYSDPGYEISPAHYWYIKGDVYVYEQTVSAYTGAANAYSKEVKIPLTITAGANGRLQLLNVQPNLYAYYKLNDQGNPVPMDQNGVKVDNESTTYYLNDVITWWDWHQLPSNEQQCFVRETVVNVDTCFVGTSVNDTVRYAAGTYALENVVKTSSDFKTFKDKVASGELVVFDNKRNTVDAAHIEDLFRSSNNISHETGYVLSFDMDTPGDWNDWYSPINGQSTYTDEENTNRKTKKEYGELSTTNQKSYIEGPTFRLKDGEAAGLYGQRTYVEGDLLSGEAVEDYKKSLMGKTLSETLAAKQAEVDEAYVAKVQTTYTNSKGTSVTVLAGNAIPKNDYETLLSDAQKANFATAYLCTSTIQLGTEEFILQGDLVEKSKFDEIADKYQEYNNSLSNITDISLDEAKLYIQGHLADAYCCTKDGLYGGQWFNKNENYDAIKAWCSLTDQRNMFEYNYDAFDVLSDSQFTGVHNDYPSTEQIANSYKSPYSDEKSVEYDAKYTGSETLEFTYKGNTLTVTPGQTISNTQYENYVVNEQKHYTHISITEGTEKIYIAKDNFIHASVPYGKGQNISATDYANLASTLTKAKLEEIVAEVDIPDSIQTEAQGHAGTNPLEKYYCYENYSYTYKNQTLSDYEGHFLTSIDDKKNFQRQFTIQGKEPTETTTLYVSRESNAKDVTTEKVITVVYQYTYYEDADEGDGVSLTNELHVVNIHLQLESGIPEIGLLNNPATVLPGTALGLKAPSVNPGLYEVLTNGWELFDSYEDAINHRNGVPFANNQTPVYWYQNQKAYVAFYSKTFLGKTYSNPVPVSVANYHDLKAVMADKDYHLHVDYDPEKLDRNCKIYINDYSGDTEGSTNGLDDLKNFFNLSYGDALEGHQPLEPNVRGGDNLEFILRTNLDYTGNEWSSLGTNTGTNDRCFGANLHGDGYTIKGLSQSLFKNLCGSVYNLGVTGSFTGAGVADTGDGYVENCWVKTTGTPATDVKAVFGNPSRGDGRQIVNCYYPESNAYSETNNPRGNAIKMSDQAFYNGTVAYNLNDFYLNKRYYDKKRTTLKAKSYNYLEYEADGVTLKDNYTQGYYPATIDAQYGDVGYVERRYEDGDFRYAEGTIPGTLEKRQRTLDVKDKDGNKIPTTFWAPVWPEDYIFFGQALNYGHVTGQTHQDEPSSVTASTRVYRAPAYYRSSKMGVAHYNKEAVFAATQKNNATKVAFKGMTAIDFSGDNDYLDANYMQGQVAATETKEACFYPPLLDDEGITSFTNVDLTRNLLVYTTASRPTTDKTVNDYLKDRDEEMVVTDDTYLSVKPADDLVSEHVKGHWIQDKVAVRDHLLVDKEDFNCPISYTFAEGKRMWYQRIPDNYAGQKIALDSNDQPILDTAGEPTYEMDTKAGWESISLPFTAELVTTQDKGEITHFYDGSTKGHEYWLREYRKMTVDAEESTADMYYPNAGSDTKEYTNTFLWDFYYSKDSYKDLNTDEYQKTYYRDAHDMENYPYIKAATPYIVGFPGEFYYEFDLSGKWNPQNRVGGVTIEHPGQQTITFASEASTVNNPVTIGVSDTELLNGAEGPYKGYYFKPNYLNIEVPGNGYIMDSNGASYEMVTSSTDANKKKLSAFRTYFEADSKVVKAPTRRIRFNNVSSQLGGDEQSEGNMAENVDIRAGKRKVIVTSNLKTTADVRIFNVSGLCVATFNVEPGETIETPLYVDGVYVVHAAGGRYRTKLVVK